MASADRAKLEQQALDQWYVQTVVGALEAEMQGIEEKDVPGAVDAIQRFANVSLPLMRRVYEIAKKEIANPPKEQP